MIGMRYTRYLFLVALAACALMRYAGAETYYAACWGSPVTEDDRIFLSDPFTVELESDGSFALRRNQVQNHFRHYLNSTYSYNNGNNATCNLYHTMEDAKAYLQKNRSLADGRPVVETGWSE
jgi:hypothetical protein